MQFKKQTLRPLLFLQIYLTATVLLFFFGPWPWPIDNAPYLAFYLIAVQASLAGGYLFANRNARSSPAQIQYRPKKLFLAKVCIVTTFVAAIIGMMNYSAEIRAGSSLMQTLASAGSDLGEAYRQKSHNIRQLGEGVSQKYALIPAMMAVMALPLGIAYWGEFSAAWRFTFVVSRMFELCAWIISGTSKGVVDTLIIGAFFAFCLYARDRSASHRAVSAAGTCVLILTTLFYFGESKVRGPSETLIQDLSLPIVADLAHPSVAAFERNDAIVLCVLFNYLTQGYYALARSFEFPFVWCWLCGHGPLATELASGLGIVDVSEQTLPARMESIGWDRGVRWHTLYVWIASDLSHFGVPVFMFAIGMLFARSWRATLLRTSPFAIVLSYLIIQMLFYIPANNQVLGFEATALAFWTSVVGVTVRTILKPRLKPNATA